ncbi:hypothetical protein, partial [Candidatus Frankia nodulisporulans]|uniref:hypothetical protein n=2 Tax=Candidatus Frankia nodulisporulans TaxID=2060052 RepID=UPI001CDC222D
GHADGESRAGAIVDLPRGRDATPPAERADWSAMNGRVLPASVGRFEGWLIRVLARPWVWVAAAGVLLIAAAAQAGFDDRFLMSIMIVVPVAFVVQLPRVAAVLVVFAALGWFFPQAGPMPVAAGTGLLVVCGVAAYRLTAPEICLCGALFPSTP